MIFLVIFFFIGVILFEVPSLVRKKYWRELAVFSIFLSLSLMIAVLQILGVQLPSPAKGIDYLFEDVLKLRYH